MTFALGLAAAELIETCVSRPESKHLETWALQRSNKVDDGHLLQTFAQDGAILAQEFTLPYERKLLQLSLNSPATSYKTSCT